MERVQCDTPSDDACAAPRGRMRNYSEGGLLFHLLLFPPPPHYRRLLRLLRRRHRRRRRCNTRCGRESQRCYTKWVKGQKAKTTMRKMEAAIKQIRENNEATSLYTTRNAAHASSASSSTSSSFSPTSSPRSRRLLSNPISIRQCLCRPMRWQQLSSKSRRSLRIHRGGDSRRG